MRKTNLRLRASLLDCSRLDGVRRRRRSKFEYGAKLVASLAYLMLGQTESSGRCAYAAPVWISGWRAASGGTIQLSSHTSTRWNVPAALHRQGEGLPRGMAQVCRSRLASGRW